MTYDVHIHRAEDYVDAAANPIPREDWEAWVANAPDFRFHETDYVAFNYEDGERKERLAVWTQHPEGQEPALFYYGGSVESGNPDEHTLRRMARVAADLGARLQGDDGEFYTLDGEPMPED
jgi:hypothetical protein